MGQEEEEEKKKDLGFHFLPPENVNPLPGPAYVSMPSFVSPIYIFFLENF